MADIKVFVRNTSHKTIREFKPGLGEFIIPAQDELEIQDVYDAMETPIKTKVPYLKYTARTVAESIVQDYGQGHLEVIVRKV